MRIAGINPKANLSKAEEIEILQTLQNEFENTGNYLSGLFHSSAVDYMSREIQDDCMPDLFSALVNADSARMVLATEKREAETEISKLNLTVARLIQENEHLKNQLNAILGQLSYITNHYGA